MTPEELRARAEMMHGPRWQTALAIQVGVHPRTMRNYVSGTREIPAPVARLIRLLHFIKGHAINVPDRAMLEP